MDMEQYRALEEDCGVATLPLSVVRITGNDRAKFIHNFCTAEIKKLPTDGWAEAFFLNTKGRTICHGFVVAREVDLLIVSTAQSAEALTQNLDRYLLSEDVQIADVSSVWRALFVRGAKSGVILEASGVRVPQGNEVLNVGFQVVMQVELAGQGLLVLEPIDGDASTVESLVRNGAMEVSLDALHAFRIKEQTPWSDFEITDACLPQEFRRDAKAISFTKGCYLGQETVARLDALGQVNRFVAGFEITDGNAEVGDVLRKDGRKIGLVTSLATIDEQKRIGLGFLRVEYTTPGETVECDNVSLMVRQ